MAFGKLWTIAYRDLLRNQRRSIFTLLAVALGLALLIVINGLVAGMMADALQNNIRLKTGHVQLRAPSYEEKKLSLQWQDLLDNPDELAQGINRMSEVNAAAPVLWVGGSLSTGDEAAGVQIFGIDSTSQLYNPIRESLVGGEFLTPDDRGGIMIGQRLANSLEVGVGHKINVALVNADGNVDEANFTIRGLFATGIASYDESAVFMPLDKTQAFARTGQRASAIVVLLNQQDNTDKVATAIQNSGTTTLTWRDSNQLFLQMVEMAFSFYVMLDGIVMLIVAVIIANTLLMAVFERIREIGILTALGMKSQHIMIMFLFQAFILGLAGVIVGFALGSIGVAYLANVGIPLGASASAAGNTFALGSTLYAHFVPSTFLWLSFWTLVFVVLASLYPAQFAARQEPVEALRSL
ncbi:ABC transporter permease [Anaerolineales bacterium HSG24]|nr:ABC transporter permease [Anaerolineales bacterium HSG24]